MKKPSQDSGSIPPPIEKHYLFDNVGPHVNIRHAAGKEVRAACRSERSVKRF